MSFALLGRTRLPACSIGMYAKYKYQIWLQIAVIIYGFTGVLGKLISLDAYHLVWHRLVIALIALGMYLVWKRHSLALDSSRIRKLLGVGVILGAHWITFFEAIKQSNVSVSLVCFSSAALFTSFIEPFYYKRRIAWREPILALCVVFGLYFVFRSEFAFVTGMLLSIVSAALAGWFTVLNGLLVRDMDTRTITFYELLGAFLTLSVCLLILDGFSLEHMGMPLSDLGWLLILGIVCTAFSFMLGVQLVRKITPYTFAMAVNLEPIYAIVLALLIWPESETMSGGFYLGAGIVVLVIFLNSWLQRNSSTPSDARV